ncbi:MAG: glutamine--fructose-6-phosphate transaminase (isomerizing) [bacterium]|nr:glutamine--fructose-6-phosphate transaminase (isomerizing) [bacterium]
MCGIVGAIRNQGPVLAGLVEGLRVLEYRGYDSAGVAVSDEGKIKSAKRQGRLDNLEARLTDSSLENGVAGIGHTRWATHGPPSDENAHPHLGASGCVALVHNGIIENWAELKGELLADGVRFVSDTDTEVLAHLIDRERADASDLSDAVRRALRRVSGYYALAVLAETGDGPELVCARQGPPLAVAFVDDAAYLASDVLGILPHTREISFLEDGDVAVLRPGDVQITDFGGKSVVRPAQAIDWDPEDTGKGGWPHYMLKEIHEQPDVLARTIQGRIDDEAADVVFEDGAFANDAVRDVARIQVIACGTALHAGYIARYLIEGLGGVPVDVDYASEFRYRGPRIVPGTMALAISQSGETADTLAATRLARELGASVGAICNVAGSSQVRESDHVILTHAGPEIGVASTKAFTAQVAAVTLLAVRLGRARGTLSKEDASAILNELKLLRTRIESMLGEHAVDHVRRVAQSHAEQRGFLFLGRGINYPVALEGALKLKEISYMHAEGYPAGEMKHGPIALIDPGMTIVSVSSTGPLAEKVRANIEQVKARGGVVLSVGSDPESHAIAGQSLEVPASSEWLSPILNTVPLQLLSYAIADMRGCDIDKPRNLAKSVTVE